MKRDWAAITILALLAVCAYRQDQRSVIEPLTCVPFGEILASDVFHSCGDGQCFVNDHGRWACGVCRP